MEKDFQERADDINPYSSSYYPNVPDLSRHKHSNYQGIYMHDRADLKLREDKHDAFRSVDEEFDRK